MGIKKFKRREKKTKREFKRIKVASEGKHGRLMTHFSQKVMYGGKKTVLIILTVLMLTQQMRAGTKDLHPQVMALYSKMKNNEISLVDAKDSFKKIMESIDKQVQDDLKNHKHEEAALLLHVYEKVAVALGDSALARELGVLIVDVENERDLLHHKIGIFQNEGNIYVSGWFKVNQESFRGVKTQIDDDAKFRFRKYILAKLGLEKIRIDKEDIVGFTLNADGSCEYLFIIGVVETPEFTKAVAEKLPKRNI